MNPAQRVRQCLPAGKSVLFLKLTRLDGSPVWIRADAILKISRPIDGHDNSIIHVDSVVQEVEESCERILRLIDEL